MELPTGGVLDEIGDFAAILVGIELADKEGGTSHQHQHQGEGANEYFDPEPHVSKSHGQHAKPVFPSWTWHSGFRSQHTPPPSLTHLSAAMQGTASSAGSTARSNLRRKSSRLVRRAHEPMPRRTGQIG